MWGVWPLGSKTIFTPVKKWLWIIGLIGLVSACLDEPDCFRLSGNTVVISFKKLTTNKVDTVIFYHITAQSERKTADSVFYKQVVDQLDTLKGKSAFVNIDPLDTKTLFTFYFQNDVQKNLEVGYNSKVHFISEDCGSEQIYGNLTIMQTDFDSVRVINPTLTKTKSINIEIFN
jgi:hypothetical protein